MCVSGRLSVPPLHCVVDVRNTPENIDLFFFAEYPVACFGDEGEENPP